MGYVPPPPPNRPRTADAGQALRAGVMRARRRWWDRLLCLLGWHPLPLVLEHHTLSCKRCGHSWALRDAIDAAMRRAAGRK